MYLNIKSLRLFGVLENRTFGLWVAIKGKLVLSRFCLLKVVFWVFFWYPNLKNLQILHTFQQRAAGQCQDWSADPLMDDFANGPGDQVSIFLVDSYQRFKKCYLMLPCLALNIIKYGLRVSEVAPFPTSRCCSYWKGSFRVASTTVGRLTYIYTQTWNLSNGFIMFIILLFIGFIVAQLYLNWALFSSKFFLICCSCTTWTLSKRLDKKLDGNYTRMPRAILNKSWRQHPTRHQLYGHLPPITKTIQVRQTRYAGHCWRSRDELISDVLLWSPKCDRAKAGRPARTYIYTAAMWGYGM